jgi:amidase
MGFLRAWNLFFERYPVVIMPVSGELPFPDHADQRGAEAFSAIIEAQLPQVGLPLLGLPGLAVATGLSGTAPLGVQLVGGRYREDLLLAAGEAIAAAGAPPSPIDPAW